ncbi:MAG: hypothetical protein AAF652_13610 [Cyanobacteria bacterium P01_C01_bin.72]
MNEDDFNNFNGSIDDEYDAVQMAIMGTDKLDVSNWWCGAFQTVGSQMYPELKNQFRALSDYFSNAIYNYHNEFDQ